MVGRWAERAQRPPAMIFSNPSEASIVVKLEAATPAGNERPAILPPPQALLAVEAGGEPHIEGDQHQREQSADGEQPPAGLVDGRLAGRPGHRRLRRGDQGNVAAGPTGGGSGRPEPPPDPTVITPFMP